LKDEVVKSNLDTDKKTTLATIERGMFDSIILILSIAAMAHRR